jgi:small-conductance mechanosensitive channel/CRP-like cAMP-binding protein
MDAIIKFLKEKISEIYKMFLSVKPVNELFAVILGFAFFVVLKIVFKFLIKKFSLTLIKKTLNRTIFLISVMLAFSLSSSEFFAQKGLLFVSVFLVWNIYRIIDYAIFDYYIRNVKKTYAPKIVRDMIKGPAFIIVIFMMLNLLFNFSLSSIAITSAVVTGAVAFAFKETLVNLIGGISISIEKPFKIGDWIKVKNDIIGEVIQTSWRTTRLLTPTSDLYIIPNKEISNNEFFNYHLPAKVHGDIIKIGVSYEHAPNTVKGVILNILKGVDDVASNPEPFILLVNYNDFTIDYEIRYWIKEFYTVLITKDEILSKIWYAFKRENIKIPFPIRTIEYAKEKEAKVYSGIDVEILKASPLFENTQNEVLIEVGKNMDRINYGKGETVIAYDSEGAALYIVESGIFSVSARNKSGKKKRANRIEVGGVFGEMSIITDSRTMADVVAETDCVLLRLKKEVLRELGQMFPKLITDLVNYADKKIEELIAKETTEEIPEIESPAAKKTVLEKFFKYFSD